MNGSGTAGHVTNIVGSEGRGNGDGAVIFLDDVPCARSKGNETEKKEEGASFHWTGKQITKRTVPQILGWGVLGESGLPANGTEEQSFSRT